MTYHSKTFRLLKSEPILQQAAETAIAKAERRLAIAFPQAVREWYACRDAIQILAAHETKIRPSGSMSLQLLIGNLAACCRFDMRIKASALGRLFSTVRTTRRFMLMWTRAARSGNS